MRWELYFLSAGFFLWGGKKREIKMYVDHQIIRVDKYKTDELDSILRSWGKNGYKLVSTELAENRYGVVTMYLFFTKEILDK